MTWGKPVCHNFWISHATKLFLQSKKQNKSQNFFMLKTFHDIFSQNCARSSFINLSSDWTVTDTAHGPHKSQSEPLSFCIPCNFRLSPFCFTLVVFSLFSWYFQSFYVPLQYVMADGAWMVLVLITQITLRHPFSDVHSPFSFFFLLNVYDRYHHKLFFFFLSLYVSVK